MKTCWVVKFKPSGEYMSYLDLQPHSLTCAKANIEWTKDRLAALRFKHLSSALAVREFTASFDAAVFRLRGIK